MAFPTRVLVAHYDVAEVERIRRWLAAAGAEVVTAADGDAALRAAAEARPELALVAGMLSGVSGFEVCRRFVTAEGERPAIPCVVLTDAEDPYVRARARHVGAKRVLVAPLHELALRELLKTSWESVDPLALSSRESGGAQNDRLIRDLIDGEPGPGDESLLAKVSDSLTGLVNSEYVALKLQEECKRCVRYGHPLSLLLLEVKGYDRLVEQHGRASGDEALLEVAGVLLCESRDVDVAGRVGPARFELLLPNTPAEGARSVAQRIRTSLADRTLHAGGHEVRLDVRVGLATLAGTGTRGSVDDFARQAEADLAAAQLTSDGLGPNLHGTAPVEPLASAPPPQIA